MKIMMIKMMVMMSTLTSMMKNPMSMGMLLIMQTMFMIMFINTISNTSWFMMITFMMMIGGLLILFMYMSSIASNEKFKMKLNLTMILMLMLIWWDDKLINNQISETMNLMIINEESMALTKLYNKKSMMITMMLVLYLLLTMISVSKMVKHYKGPLRSYKKYE
uniref:NADH dehydrogenase subunit 6 n=1 Tax=Uzeldikra longiprocessa TaxID=2893152 RepID=A0A9E7BVB3_9HEMI|nr:NADH dehydrogenase subunit 6 [Uzeldikra longiprocessa]UGN61300.1 NADH dehydrogenase subunit 6 [Uzeldikra longiprocessa]